MPVTVRFKVRFDGCDCAIASIMLDGDNHCRSDSFTEGIRNQPSRMTIQAFSTMDHDALGRRIREGGRTIFYNNKWQAVGQE